jgi:hypothetical protein
LQEWSVKCRLRLGAAPVGRTISLFAAWIVDLGKNALGILQIKK